MEMLLGAGMVWKIALCRGSIAGNHILAVIFWAPGAGIYRANGGCWRTASIECRERAGGPLRSAISAMANSAKWRREAIGKAKNRVGAAIASAHVGVAQKYERSGLSSRFAPAWRLAPSSGDGPRVGRGRGVPCAACRDGIESTR